MKGMAYDCQAVGLFNLMDNHLFKIQGHFAAVREEEEIGHLSHVGGSLLNDAIIQFKLADYKTVQLGFGDVSSKIDIPPSQIGCIKMQDHDGVSTNMYWAPEGKEGLKQKKCSKPNKNGNFKEKNKLLDADCFTTGDIHGDNSTKACRRRCEMTDGCEKFNYWADERCEIFRGDAVLRPAIPKEEKTEEDEENKFNSKIKNLNLAGTIDSECGVEHKCPEYNDGNERLFHGMIGKNKQQQCPLLLHLDEELIDISPFAEKQKGWMHGTKKDDFRIEMENNMVRVYFAMPGDSDETAMVSQSNAPSDFILSKPLSKPLPKNILRLLPKYLSKHLLESFPTLTLVSPNHDNIGHSRTKGRRTRRKVGLPLASQGMSSFVTKGYIHESKLSPIYWIDGYAEWQSKG